jgi:hypothetical protein
LLCKIIVSDAAGVYHGVGRENVLGTISGHRDEYFAFCTATLTAAPRAAFWAAPPATQVTWCSLTSSLYLPTRLLESGCDGTISKPTSDRASPQKGWHRSLSNRTLPAVPLPW